MSVEGPRLSNILSNAYDKTVSLGKSLAALFQKGSPKEQSEIFPQDFGKLNQQATSSTPANQGFQALGGTGNPEKAKEVVVGGFKMSTKDQQVVVMLRELKGMSHLSPAEKKPLLVNLKQDLGLNDKKFESLCKKAANMLDKSGNLSKEIKATISNSSIKSHTLRNAQAQKNVDNILKENVGPTNKARDLKGIRDHNNIDHNLFTLAVKESMDGLNLSPQDKETILDSLRKS